MDNQPVYPYRDTTGTSEQEVLRSSQYPQAQPGQPPVPMGTQAPQPQYPQPQYPQPQYSQSQYPQPQYPQPQYPNPSQAYPTGGYAGMGYGAPVAPTNTLATVALALGVVGTLFSLLGYVIPNTMTFVIVMCLVLPAIALGVVGILTSRRLGGLKFGQALTGVVLGAFSVVLFCVLATAQTGSLAGIFAGGEDSAVSVGSHDEDDQTDPTDDEDESEIITRDTLFANRLWTGFIDPNGGNNWVISVSIRFLGSGQDNASGDFEWSEEDSESYQMAIKAKGSFSVKFGEDALTAAQSDGFSLEPAGGEDFVQWTLRQPDMDLVYIEFIPSESQSDIMGNQPVRWFGYVYGEESVTLDIYRKTDEAMQFFRIDE